MRDFDKNQDKWADKKNLFNYDEEDQLHIQDPDDTKMGKIWVVLKLAVPSIMCTLIFYFQ